MYQIATKNRIDFRLTEVGKKQNIGILLIRREESRLRESQFAKNQYEEHHDLLRKRFFTQSAVKKLSLKLQT